MRTASIAGTFAGSLLMVTALTPLRAADMTHERALNPQCEPENWILHHGNYKGHRFSALKDIDTNTVKNMRLAYTVALKDGRVLVVIQLDDLNWRLRHGERRFRRGRPPGLDPGHAARLQLANDLGGDLVIQACPVRARTGASGRASMPTRDGCAATARAA